MNYSLSIIVLWIAVFLLAARSGEAFLTHNIIGRRMPIQQLGSSSGSAVTPTELSDDENSTLLEGKLSILQEVVKELKHRQDLSTESAAKLKAAHAESIQNLEQRLEEGQQSRKEDVNVLEARLKQQQVDHEQAILKVKQQKDTLYQEQLAAVGMASTEQLERTQRGHRKVVATLREELEQVQEESAQRLTAQLEQKKAAHQKAMAEAMQEKDAQLENLSVQLQALQAKFQHQSRDHQEEVKTLRTSNTQLQEQLETAQQQRQEEEASKASAESQEQVEIAIAAVEAASKREARLQQQLRQVERKIKLANVQMKLLTLAFQGALQEQQSAAETNEITAPNITNNQENKRKQRPQ